MNTTTQAVINTYKQAKALSTNELDESYRGKALSLPGCSYLPDFLYRVILTLINSPLINFVWKGKYFNKGHGSNLWFRCKPKFLFAHYDYSDEQNTVHLNYNVPRNPEFARRFSAVLKRSSNNADMIIGQAFFNGKPKLYFSLEKVINDGI